MNELKIFFLNLVVLSYFITSFQLNQNINHFKMKKLLFYFLSFAIPLSFNSCKSKLFGYDDKVNLPAEKLCFITSTTDSASSNTINYIFNKNHLPLKGFSSDKRTFYTYEYDGRDRWAKYLFETTDSSRVLWNFSYNDTTNLIKEIITYNGYQGSTNFTPTIKLNYFYDSLSRVIKIDKYLDSEGWYKATTQRLIYDSKNNLIQIFFRNYNTKLPEYLQIEFTEFDDKINFIRTSPIFQIQNLRGITSLSDKSDPIPNFSKNNPTKGKFYIPQPTTGLYTTYDLNYQYIYNSSNLPINSILNISINRKQNFRINTHFNYNCSN